MKRLRRLTRVIGFLCWLVLVFFPVFLSDRFDRLASTIAALVNFHDATFSSKNIQIWVPSPTAYLAHTWVTLLKHRRPLLSHARLSPKSPSSSAPIFPSSSTPLLA